LGGVRLDVCLPLILASISGLSLILHIRYGGRVRALLGGGELRARDAVILVSAMGGVVTLFAYIHKSLIAPLLLAVCSAVLYTLTYLIVPRWYVAVITPSAFILLYHLWWNEGLLNLFSILFALFVSVYLGSLFTWRTAMIFAGLLTLMDAVQVFWTGYMVTSSQRLIELGLPLFLIAPMFPTHGRVILGLGDVFLSSLLTIQTATRYGRGAGFTSIIAITLTFMILENLLLNSPWRFFPATVMVSLGWLVAVGLIHLKNLLRR